MKPRFLLIYLLLAFLVLTIILPSVNLYPLAGLIALIALIDAVISYPSHAISIERRLPESCILGREMIVTLNIRPKKRLKKPLHIQIDDCLPPTWHSEESRIESDLMPDKITQLRYRATPQMRGDAVFEGIDYTVPSLLGLWWRVRRLPEKQKMKVLPDCSLILGSDLMSLNRWLAMVGSKPIKRYGAGQAFHQLRDFNNGDDIRHIDWKATARMRKHIVRTFQDEKDRQLIFLLDCGRNMRMADGEKTHFDYALNSLILLSYTALKHDDAVGLMTFNHPTARTLPARRGVAQIGKMVQALYDVQPSLKANDFEYAINQLLQKQRRRALIIVLSHLNHEDNQSLSEQLARLNKKHLLIFANLRPTLSQELCKQEIDNLDQSLAYIGAQFYQQEEKNTIRQFNSLGICHLHVAPQKLNNELINQYLKIRHNRSW